MRKPVAYYRDTPVFDLDTFVRDAESGADAGAVVERAGGDDGRPIPAFLRRGPALPASSPPVNEKTRQLGLDVEQGIYDLLHEDYGIRPSAGRAANATLFRRALAAIANGLGGRRARDPRSRDVRFARDPYQLPTARFPARAPEGSDETGFRWPSTGDTTNEGAIVMDEQPAGTFPRIPPDIGRTRYAPICDPEIEEFATRVRGYVRENAALKARVEELEAQLAQVSEQRDRLGVRLSTIAAHATGDETACPPTPPAISE